MKDDLLPWHFPRYCIKCGALLIYKNITAGAERGEASSTCSGCGDQSGFSWSEFSSSYNDQHVSSSPDEPAILLPFPIDTSDTAHEAQAQYAALQQQIRAHGVVAIVQAAHFPLFAFEAGYGRFLVQGHGWEGGRWSEGRGLGPPLSSLHLSYAGPSYQHIAERIIIEQEDREASWLSGIPGESYILDPDHIARFLAGLPDPDVPSMRSLWEGDAIRQFVNEETVTRAPVAYRQTELQSGEVVSWAIREFKAPLPIAHAGALIEGTRIDVGAIGPAANDLEHVLRHLSRLIPESETLNHLAQGLQAWNEYLHHHYWPSLRQ